MADNVLLFLKSLPASNQKLDSRAETETGPPTLWCLSRLLCAFHPSMERFRPWVLIRILKKIRHSNHIFYATNQTHLPRPILGHTARAVNSEGKVFEYNSHTSPIVFIGDVPNASLYLSLSLSRMRKSKIILKVQNQLILMLAGVGRFYCRSKKLFQR